MLRSQFGEEQNSLLQCSCASLANSWCNAFLRVSKVEATAATEATIQVQVEGRNLQQRSAYPLIARIPAYRFYTAGFVSAGSNYLEMLSHIESWILSPGTVKIVYPWDGQPPSSIYGSTIKFNML